MVVLDDVDEVSTVLSTVGSVAGVKISSNGILINC